MASRNEYEMLFKLSAQLGQNFNGTFSSAQKTLAATQKEIQSLNKLQSDISSYTKHPRGGWLFPAFAISSSTRGD